MSGGVDSAVSAFLLKKEGHEVVGANMRFWEYPKDDTCSTEPKKKSRHTSCCSPEDMADAEHSARTMGIPFYALKMEGDFRENVIDPFIRDYESGLTPNPCVHCNTFIKFGEFYDKATALGFDQIATGHYANIVHLPNGRYAIAPAADQKKDQSYYLYGMSQNALQRTVFPLAKLIKDEVRRIADDNSIPVAQKPDSQEICFIPDNDHRAFLKREGVDLRAGYFRDPMGMVLGTHDGSVGFTVGQRKGLGIAGFSEAQYVLEVRANGDVILGSRKALERRIFFLRDAIFQGVSKDDPVWQNGLDSKIQIRYNGKRLDAKVFLVGTKGEADCLRVELKEPAWAVSPGQAGVLYHPQEGYIFAGGKIKLQS